MAGLLRLETNPTRTCSGYFEGCIQRSSWSMLVISLFKFTILGGPYSLPTDQNTNGDRLITASDKIQTVIKQMTLAHLKFAFTLAAFDSD